MCMQLKQKVYEANMMLKEHDLVTFTWGNVSAVDRNRGVMVIKPSGVEYNNLSPLNMVEVSLETGEVLGGSLRPSSDTPTHIELYKNFLTIGGIAHTHSRWATVFAQAKKEIPAYGTTHGDYFYGSIPCTRLMKEQEIKSDYEANTGRVIIEAFKGKNPLSIPAALVASHGPFTWGIDAGEAVHNAVVLEELAFMAYHTKVITGDIQAMDQCLLDKHYLRKHGKDAYYGQGKGK